MKRHLLILSLLGCLLLPSMLQAQPVLRNLGLLREGDLLFHVAQQENPITQSTNHMGDYSLDHVAIYFLYQGCPSVVEAVEKGVVITPLDSFLLSGEQYLVGRVKSKLDRKHTIKNALNYLGHPYDFYFLPDEQEIYCSELVLLSFVDKHGRAVFAPVAMSFHDSEGQILPYWTAHYATIGHEVPEGLPGSNPSELAKRKNVKIKGIFSATAP